MPKQPLRILVPLDGSTEAEAALEAIRPLVETAAPDVLLLSVLQDPRQGEATRVYLRKAFASVYGSGIEPRCEIRLGDPTDEILLSAEQRRVDLISLSTHGRKGISRLFAGSVTEHVLRRTNVPLLTCRPGTPSRSWSRIVLALDGSRSAEEILVTLIPLARTLSAHVDVVEAVVPIGPPEGFAELAIPVPPEDPKPYLARVCSRLEAEGISASPVVLEGRAVSAILKHASASGAGLISLASHGRSGISRTILGSIAEEILRRAPCPLLVHRMASVARPVALVR